MTCQNCKSELTPTLVYRYIDGALKVQQGYECRRCYAIYDANGVRLEEPLTNDKAREDEEAKKDE